jgi:hypothetical protein
MIKKFNQYNESIRDKMTPKSEEELEEAKKDFLNKMKKVSQDPNEMSETLSYYLQGMYDTKKELLNDLIDKGLDAGDLLVMITDELDLNELTEREKRYKLRVMDMMYKLIEENIDKIENLEDL